ncbi:hypothetical protein JCM6882_008478 [Rhodosporidiobolus microsporus]
MSLFSRRPVLTTFLLVGTPTAAVLASYFSSLSSRYPPLAPPASSPLLHPDAPNQRLEDVAVFAARVPLRSVLPPPPRLTGDGASPPPPEQQAVELQALTTRLVHALLATPLIRLETALLGAFNPFASSSSSSSPSSPSAPPDSFFHPGQRLVGGALQVVHPARVELGGGGGDGGGEVGRLTVKWAIDPPTAVRFFERLAAWGYPFRLMNGGRHVFEVEVSEPQSSLTLSSFSSSHSDASRDSSSRGAGASSCPPDGQEERQVELRFGCAHDYTRLVAGSEGKATEGEDDGKKLPAWSSWAHLMYARALLDMAVKGMQREAGRGQGEGR